MQLAEVLLFESDRESLDRLARFLAHQRHHGARIDAAGKECAERDFRHQAHPDRGAQDLDGPLARFRFADLELSGEVGKPVTLDFDFALFPTQTVARLELLDCAISGEWRGHTHEREVMMERIGLDLPADLGMKEQRAKLGSENQLAI